MYNLKLSPPWYTLRNQIANSLGVSPDIDVSDLTAKNSSEYIIKLKVKSNSIATSLRTILPTIYNFQTIKVSTVILNSTNTIISSKNPILTSTQVAKNFCNVLNNNPLFKGIVIPPDSTPFIGSKVFVIIDKTIIQFFDDDLSDICQNFNEIAAKVFSNILIKNYSIPNNKNKIIPVYFSTYNKNCIDKQKLFCP